MDKEKEIKETMEEAIRKDMNIDDTDIAGELRKQASKFYYWGAMKARASGKTRGLKAYHDTLKAEKGKKFREDMAIEDPKVRVTERMLDDFLDTNEEVRKSRQQLIEGQYAEDLLEITVEALRQKHYDLIELSKSKEAERMMTNEYEKMKIDFEEREGRKRK